MSNENFEEYQRNELWDDASHRAKKALRARHRSSARQEDIEDAVHNTVEYFVEREAEGAVKVPVNGSDNEKEAFIGMVIHRAYDRYLDFVAKEHTQKDLFLPPSDEVPNPLRPYDIQELRNDARQFEMEIERLDGKHPEYKRRERKKFIDEQKKYYLNDEEV